MRHLFPSLLVLLLLPACTTTSTTITIDVTSGQETDAFTEAPAVTNVAVTVTSQDGSINVTANASPGGTFDFGDGFDNTEQIGVSIVGTASTGPVMGGQTLSGLLLSSLGGTLPVFAQRTGQWSRPPGGLAASHVNGVASVTQDRYLAVTGGTAPAEDPTSVTDSVDSYDLFGLTGDATTTYFSTVPQTIVPIPLSDYQSDVQSLLISDTGLELYDFTAGSDNTGNAPLTLPTGMTSWSDVTGGAVLSDGAGRAFVVGATRSTGATTAVLDVEVDTNGDVVLTNYPLSFKRAGAAAAYIAGVGLVVAGGSETAPGIEVLSPTGAAFVPQGDYPPIEVAGAGAVTDGTSGLVLVGGVRMAGGGIAPTIDVDLSCVTGCMMPMSITAATLPIALVNVSAYQLSGGKSLAVGTQVGDGGFTRSYIVDVSGAGSATEALLKEPRTGASVIPAPNATLALLGGQHADGTPALSVELFLP